MSAAAGVFLTSGFASLAIAATDGSVSTVEVRRRAVDGTWDLHVGEPHEIVPAKKRLVTYIQWVKTGYPNNPAPQEDMLVWAKPGTVHLATKQGVQNIRLQRVGNWAGCNALDPCIGELMRADAADGIRFAREGSGHANGRTFVTDLPCD